MAAPESQCMTQHYLLLGLQEELMSPFVNASPSGLCRAHNPMLHKQLCTGSPLPFPSRTHRAIKGLTGVAGTSCLSLHNVQAWISASELGKSHLFWCCCCLLTVASVRLKAQGNILGERGSGQPGRLRTRYAVDPSSNEKLGRCDQEHRVMVPVP